MSKRKHVNGNGAHAPEYSGPPLALSDDMVMPAWLREALDKAESDGTANLPDDRRAWKIKPPSEAGLVRLPNAELLFIADPTRRVANKWRPVAHLQATEFGGQKFLKARRLHLEASVPIFMQLESLFGRGEAYDPERGSTGMEDSTSRQMQSTERVTLEAAVEVENSGKASHSVFIKFRGTWLGFRKIYLSELRYRRASKPPRDMRGGALYPHLSII